MTGSWLLANVGGRKNYTGSHTTKRVCLCLHKSPEMILVFLIKAFLMLKRSAEVTVAARNPDQAIFKCPKPVQAEAATSQIAMEHLRL
eukprot:3999229-Pleurochrysis_carterae.AAC.1